MDLEQVRIIGGTTSTSWQRRTEYLPLTYWALAGVTSPLLSIADTTFGRASSQLLLMR